MDAELKLEVWNIDQSEDACRLNGFGFKQPHLDPVSASNSAYENGFKKSNFKSKDGADNHKDHDGNEEDENEGYLEFNENDSFSVVELDPKGEFYSYITSVVE